MTKPRSYAECKAAGICVHCHSKRARPHRVTCEVCYQRDKDARSKRYQTLKAAGLCVRCGKCPAFRFGLCEEHYLNHKSRVKGYQKTATWRKNGKAYRTRLRKKVITQLGGMCTCCGETQFEFLAIDHINNDGAVERRRLNIRGGTPQLRAIVALGYPRDRYQVLCHNCNTAKATHGICPHQIPKAV